MASTSASTSGHTEREPTTPSQGVAPPSSPSSSKGLFSCCLDWFSVFPSGRTSVESNSMVSTSDSSGCIPQNEAFQETATSASTSGTCGCSPFEGMAPSASAMGRSSTLVQKPSYQVFINHRGTDVKGTLASKIYYTLEEMKVTAFLDSKELECGDLFHRILETTIRGAALHIAIFSERYAESAWCLDELSLMLKSGAKIIPVFYYVEPTDLRYADQSKGKFVAAFNKHKEKGRCRPEKLKEWKDALYKVSFYAGEIIKNDGDESRMLKNIVNIVLKEISNVPLEVAKYPVGLHEIVKDFENEVQLDDDDQSVQIVGIWGMGGSGKTTLAKEVYNKRSSSMEKKSFIFDIRDAKDELHKKQIQLLEDFCERETVHSVNQGKAIIRRCLRAFKVLIVMDDVDHVDQLDALLPTTDNLGRGSLIIVTTRELKVLTTWGISSVYKMKGLDQSYAKQLFCWHAFLKPYPLNGFEELVKDFIDVCNGLPLSLKVLGAELYGNPSKQFWSSLFDKISRILPEDIKNRLKISYDSLDHEEKEAFLDCACFFISTHHNVAIEVWNGSGWNGSGWSGLYTWQKLLNKCLVELDNDNCIRMHDHLRDLGREIAEQHSPSRIWSFQQIIKYGKQKENVKDIRGIQIDSSQKIDKFLYREVWIPYSEGLIPRLEGLIPYLGLKLLVIDGDYLIDYFNQIISEVSIGPLWLRWVKIKHRTLPPGLSLKNLRVLEISQDRRFGEEEFEELWEAESEVPLQLRELAISNCRKFQRLPNSIGCLNELRKMVIDNSNRIRSLPESFCRLQLLEHLELRSCTMLSSLPCRFGDLTNLRYLSLSGCGDLKNLPVSFRNLSLLQYLDLEGCKKLILEPDDFQNITMLEFLSLNKCYQLAELPRDIINQVSLRELHLEGVYSFLTGTRLREIPIEIGQLRRLQKLDMACDLLKSLPNSLGDLSSLTHLKISSCPNLESLPNSLGGLSSLTCLKICGCPNLESLPNSLGGLSSLTDLEIHWCRKIRYLPFSVGNLRLLEELRILDCPIDFWTGSLSFPLSNLKQVKLLKTEVFRISIAGDSYPNLESLELCENDHLREIEALPPSLKCLNIHRNPELAVLPSFARLTSLRELEVRGCDRIEKIEGLKDCAGLEKLSVEISEEALAIESLERMEKLRKVELRANNGSAIVSCIQTITRWPDEVTICTRVIPDASSLLDSSLLEQNVFVDNSFIDDLHNLQRSSSSSRFFEERKLLLDNHSINGNALMLCFVIKSALSSPVQILLNMISSMHFSEGTWALIGVFRRRCTWLIPILQQSLNYWGWEHVELERSVAVWVEERRLVEALVPLLQSISS